MSKSESIKILVVDDVADVRNQLARVLARRGYHAVTASDGRKAIGLLSRDPDIDLVVTDIDMPDVNGHELLAWIRENRPELATVMITTLPGSDVMFDAYDEGADYFISKPFRATTVTNIVEYLVGDLSEDQRAALELVL